MITQQAQIKVNLPLALKQLIEKRATRVGMPIATYLKHLILKEVENIDYPIFEASERTIQKAKAALKNKDKAVLVEDVGKLFKGPNAHPSR